MSVKLNGLGIVVRVGAVLGLASMAAHGSFEYEGDGNWDIGPFYTSLAAQGFAGFGDPPDWFTYHHGSQYASNIGLQPVTTVDVTTHFGGAMVESFGTSIHNGIFSARNFVSMYIENAQAADGYYTVAGRGSRTTVEFFTEQAAPARTRFIWRVTGTESAPVGEATSRIDFLAGPYADKDWDYLFDPASGAMTEFGPGEYVYDIVAQLQTPIDLFFWSSAYAQINKGEAEQDQTYLLYANYGSTYELIQIQLFDEEDNLIPEWHMVDHVLGKTVFDQNGVIPEPSSMALLLLGTTALLRRRRSSRA
ncbi:MAG: PEP-CTERM sorting domain-containing protein [Phycisphaeraceae bacterium]|nr:PEP-CTERM sorting domain-containing protein [Phycisphaeraceae bacterium]